MGETVSSANESWIVAEMAPGHLADDETWASFRSALRAEIERRGGTIAAAGAGGVVGGVDGGVDGAGDTSGNAVAIVGCGAGTETVCAAAASATIDSLVLVRCELSDDAIDMIAESEGIAVLTIVDPADRDRLGGAIQGHLASSNEDSDVVVEPFDAAAIADRVATWLEHRVRSGVHVEDVTLRTPDGWVLGADLHLPAGAVAAAPVPAVVLMHTGRSDRAVFGRLAKLMARRGVAALSLDWRGRGTSTNLGRFVDFTREQQQTIRRDVTAAYDHLCTLPEIDGGRLGVLGIAHGAGYGAEGALGDPRTRAVALMTAYHLLDDRQRIALESGEVAVLCVACTPNTASAGAMREVYRVSANRSSRLIEYPEGVLGYQLFDLHPDLEPAIVDWFAEVLGA